MVKYYFILILIILMGCDKETAKIDKSKVVKKSNQLPLVQKEKTLLNLRYPIAEKNSLEKK